MHQDTRKSIAVLLSVFCGLALIWLWLAYIMSMTTTDGFGYQAAASVRNTANVLALGFSALTLYAFFRLYKVARARRFAEAKAFRNTAIVVFVAYFVGIYTLELVETLVEGFQFRVINLGYNFAFAITPVIIAYVIEVVVPGSDSENLETEAGTE